MCNFKLVASRCFIVASWITLAARQGPYQVGLSSKLQVCCHVASSRRSPRSRWRRASAKGAPRLAATGGSRLKACGWPLGKKKRAAMRCHWCTPGGEHSAPPCAAQAQKPDDPQDPSSPAACPLRPLVKPLFLWRDGEVQEMQSTVPNFSIRKVRHVSGPCW
jgi:hypothetical protein